ncbi:MAG TPA: ABC transporter permease [Defluviitaleaceae bacterium]|jgi:ABC-2 type transport system permease protein|nr:ABC transporter permease subunit [Candidatus Epulonipiscium sp.]HOA80854.1 ABC transporter permease [Defluviitaleaceae bacterium]
MMINPVLRLELKTKLRTWKAPVLLLVYLTILAGFGSLILLATLYRSYDNSFDPQDVLTVYALLAGCQMGLIILLIPALTAGTISGERERQTLDLLLITRVSSFSIIMGKLIASISQIMLLIFASIPIFSVIFIFGGVSLINILLLFLYYAVISIMLGSIGIFCSTYFKKTTVATVVSYLFILIFSIGTLVVYFIMQEYSYMTGQNGLTYLQSIILVGGNPFLGFISIIQNQVGADIINYLLNVYNNPNNVKIELWQFNLVFNSVVSIIMILLSVIRIRPLAGKNR